MIESIALLACLVLQRGPVFEAGEQRLEIAKGEAGVFQWTLRRRGSVLWTVERPHSASEAFVCGDGTVVAYGFDRPEANWSDRASALAILGPDGAARLFELRPVRGFVTEGIGAYPLARGLAVWETLDACAFWIRNCLAPDEVVTFQLSTGSRRGSFEPESLLAAKAQKEKVSMRTMLGPGGNELLLTTHTDGVRGLVALFSLKGELVAHEELPLARFCGALHDIESSRDDVRFRLDVDEVQPREGVVAPGKPRRVDTLSLHYHRDEGGVWRKV